MRHLVGILLLVIKILVLAYLAIVGLLAIAAFPVLLVPLAFRNRFVEAVVAAVWLALVAIPMALIALGVRLESPGAAIFRQERCGRGGKSFTMLKFRTMRVDTDPYGVSPHGADDPRLTRWGRFLRETSLDELPQLMNVLGGTMSFVGPRPLYQRQAELWDQRQRRRLEVLPGITGYAQAYGRGSLTLEEKIELDIYYVEHRRGWLDFVVIVKTIRGIIRGAISGRGEVYEDRYSDTKKYETDAGNSGSAGRIPDDGKAEK